MEDVLKKHIKDRLSLCKIHDQLDQSDETRKAIRNVRFEMVLLCEKVLGTSLEKFEEEIEFLNVKNKTSPTPPSPRTVTSFMGCEF